MAFLFTSESHAIGVDIGGTRIKIGACRLDGESMLHQEMRATRDGELIDGIPAWAMEIRNAIGDMETKFGRAKGIGIAAPGLVRKDGRAIEFMSGRMEGLAGFDWPSWLGREDVEVVNDAHAALLGEVWRGAAKGLKDVVMITLGTGVGGAILSEGKLLRGHLGRAGHIGHLSVNADGPRTIANMPGGLDWAIGNATVAERSNGKFQNTAELFEAVAAEESTAIAVWDQSIRLLACGLASVINVVDPECILVGGGIAEIGDPLFARLRHHLASVEWKHLGAGVEIKPAELGEWAGVWGAAWASQQ